MATNLNPEFRFVAILYCVKIKNDYNKVKL